MGGVGRRTGIGVGGAVLLDQGDGGTGRGGCPLGHRTVGPGPPRGLGEVAAQVAFAGVRGRRGRAGAVAERRRREEGAALGRVAGKSVQAHQLGGRGCGAHAQPCGLGAGEAGLLGGLVQDRGERTEEAVAPAGGGALGVGGAVGCGEDTVAVEAVARSGAVGGRHPGRVGVAAVRGRLLRRARGVAGGPGVRAGCGRDGRGRQRGGDRRRGAGRKSGVEEAVGGEEDRIAHGVDGGRVAAVREEELLASLTGHHGERGTEDPRGEGGQQVGAAVVAGAALGRGRFAVRDRCAVRPRLARERAGQGHQGECHPLPGGRPEVLREAAERVELGLLGRTELHSRLVEFVLGEGVRGIHGEGVEQVLVAVLPERPGEAFAGGVDGLGGDRGVGRVTHEAVGEVGAEQVGQPAPVLGGGEQRVEERRTVVRHVVHLAHRGAVRRGEGARGSGGAVADRVRRGRLGPPFRRRVLLRPVRHRDRGGTLVVGGEAGSGEVQPVVVGGRGVGALLPAVDLVTGGLPGDHGRGRGGVPLRRLRPVGVAVAERGLFLRAQVEPCLPGTRAGVVVAALGLGEVAHRLGEVVPGLDGLGGEGGVVQEAVLAGDVLAQPDEGGGLGLDGTRAACGVAERAQRTAVGEPVVHLGHRQPAHRKREEHAAVGDHLEVGSQSGVGGALGRDAVVGARDRDRGTRIGHTGVAVARQRRRTRGPFDVVGDARLRRVGGLRPLHGLHARLVLHGEQAGPVAVHLRVEAGVGGVELSEEAGGGLRRQR
ncbi:hypothetical protein EES45_08540 [Streptomyces sp. ADI97-07]|nr:hypothetical protein EES45_08540 [Streptomyces sp. ADI97-07]